VREISNIKSNRSTLNNWQLIKGIKNLLGTTLRDNEVIDIAWRLVMNGILKFPTPPLPLIQLPLVAVAEEVEMGELPLRRNWNYGSNRSMPDSSRWINYPSKALETKNPIALVINRWTLLSIPLPLPPLWLAKSVRVTSSGQWEESMIRDKRSFKREESKRSMLNRSVKLPLNKRSYLLDWVWMTNVVHLTAKEGIPPLQTTPRDLCCPEPTSQQLFKKMQRNFNKRSIVKIWKLICELITAQDHLNQLVLHSIDEEKTSAAEGEGEEGWSVIMSQRMRREERRKNYKANILMSWRCNSSNQEEEEEEEAGKEQKRSRMTQEVLFIATPLLVRFEMSPPLSTHRANDSTHRTLTTNTILTLLGGPSHFSNLESKHPVMWSLAMELTMTLKVLIILLRIHINLHHGNDSSSGRRMKMRKRIVDIPLPPLLVQAMALPIVNKLLLLLVMNQNQSPISHLASSSSSRCLATIPRPQSAQVLWLEAWQFWQLSKRMRSIVNNSNMLVRLLMRWKLNQCMLVERVIKKDIVTKAMDCLGNTFPGEVQEEEHMIETHPFREVEEEQGEEEMGSIVFVGRAMVEAPHRSALAEEGVGLQDSNECKEEGSKRSMLANWDNKWITMSVCFPSSLLSLLTSHPWQNANKEERYWAHYRWLLLNEEEDRCKLGRRVEENAFEWDHRGGEGNLDSTF
jgi:hypothetical protein